MISLASDSSQNNFIINFLLVHRARSDCHKPTALIWRIGTGRRTYNLPPPVVISPHASWWALCMLLQNWGERCEGFLPFRFLSPATQNIWTTWPWERLRLQWHWYAFNGHTPVNYVCGRIRFSRATLFSPLYISFAKGLLTVVNLRKNRKTSTDKSATQANNRSCFSSAATITDADWRYNPFHTQQTLIVVTLSRPLY